jgi:hypothetical protein
VTERQQREIRALLPRVGMTEGELVRSLKIADIGDLTRERATKVIARLTERSEKPPF